MKNVVAMFCLIILVSMLGCTQSPIVSTALNSSTNQSTVAGREYYPNSDGYSWTYNVEEYAGLPNSNKYTETWTFKGTKTLNGKTVQIRSTDYPDYPDSNFNGLLLITDSQVANYGSESSPETADPQIVLTFPLAVGNNWKVKSTKDIIANVISSQETVTVPAGTFTNCFKVTRSGTGLDSGDGLKTADWWYAKNVGTIKWVLSYNDNSTDVYELKSKNF